MAKATTVDFSGVKDRGAFNPRKVPEGDYEAVITKVDDAPTKDDKPMYTFTIKLKKFSQNSYPYRCVIQENQLWKLRNIAVAAGLNVPKRRMKFDPNKLVGKTIGVTMIEDEYEGKPKGEVDAVFPVSELAEGTFTPDDNEGFEDGTDADDEGPQMAGDDDEGTAEDEAAEPKKSKKDKAAKDKGGKKKKKGKGENLEELDISDV